MHGLPPARSLEGVRVIEFCEVAPGPFCAMLLSDVGADVIKVERPAPPGLSEPTDQVLAELDHDAG